MLPTLCAPTSIEYDRIDAIIMKRLVSLRVIVVNVALLVESCLLTSSCATAMSIIVPSWSELESRMTTSVSSRGNNNNRPHPPKLIDYTLRSRNIEHDGSMENECDDAGVPRLYRERNGWCIMSERLWLALEMKGIKGYETHLIDAIGDTYDGSIDQDLAQKRPNILRDNALPQLYLPPLQLLGDDGSDKNQEHLHDGATEVSSLELLKYLDSAFPDTIPLWPPVDPNNGRELCSAQVVSTVAGAFGAAVPSSEEARESSRAAYLFCYEEGYRLDTLPLERFETFLDTAEELLSAQQREQKKKRRNLGNRVGPFFCGTTLPSAADIVWAPLLERYAIQLPCLFGIDVINPREDSSRWPNLRRWYQAMDQLPVYKCRIKGDAQSWRKVLFVDPWWPSADIWHPRDTVGPKGELKLSDEEIYANFGAMDGDLDANMWDEYCSTRPYVEAKGPEMEAAATLIRNQIAIVQDAVGWIAEHEYPPRNDVSIDNIDNALRWIVFLLTQRCDGHDAAGKSNDRCFVDFVPLVLRYLDGRM